MFNEPLGLPQGSIRAIITLVLLFSVLLLAILGRESEVFISLASTAVGYYFGTRAVEQVHQPRDESEPLTSASANEPDDGDDFEGIVPGS
jgi:hypothetical protein